MYNQHLVQSFSLFSCLHPPSHSLLFKNKLSPFAFKRDKVTEGKEKKRKRKKGGLVVLRRSVSQVLGRLGRGLYRALAPRVRAAAARIGMRRAT